MNGRILLLGGVTEALAIARQLGPQHVYSLADPPQPYFPEPLRSRRASLLPDGQLHVIAGTHHLHMEDPARVAMLIGSFLRA